ncbi:molybdopterin molybdenumtransferase MoeA [Streptomyces albireticuli]|nr:molybdopterin molybdotransferase MoeA [Streptomyces albireticuli]MCD9143835.1 molybdopterin molybdenumtransferase MoeA [Streptomyces albireticuli]MCD9161734.1 molybdopterin molybdenumtransferase MoeA [Streptomyces albireticuli]MCD9191952.1 molybdopterin molybdenumtransferase MoeA [Streptomyces albireticuli]
MPASESVPGSKPPTSFGSIPAPAPVTVPTAAPADSTPAPTPTPREYEFLFAADDARESAPMTSLPWPDARAVAARATVPLPPADQELGEALGQVLAVPLVALTDLPSFDTSAMDGWAVAGPGPWRLPAAQEGPGVLAGADHGGAPPLRDGHAVRIATGAPVPPGTTAVLRSEHGEVTGPDAPHPELHATRRLSQGQDIRPRGQECRHGDQLLPQGTVVTPAVLGLAAAAGYDSLHVTRRPRAEVLVLGDELLREGLPHGGRIRDALGPMLGPWLTALGAEVTAIRRLGDDTDALRSALAGSTADVVVTTGGTAAGPVDYVHAILRGLDAELLVDGVAVRPGHPMLLARLAPGRHLVGLPGNPLAAVAGLLTLAEPLLRTLSARPSPALYRAALTDAVKGHPDDTRLVPVVSRHSDSAEPLRFHGPAMLRGLAAADALAVIPPGGAARGARAGILELPWAAAGA